MDSRTIFTKALTLTKAARYEFRSSYRTFEHAPVHSWFLLPARAWCHCVGWAPAYLRSAYRISDKQMWLYSVLKLESAVQSQKTANFDRCSYWG